MFNEEATQAALCVNRSKTKLILLEGGLESSPIANGNDLDSEVSNTGNFLTEMNIRCRLASDTMRNICRRLWQQSYISRHTKLRVYNSAVLYVLIYDAEKWPLSKNLVYRIYGPEFHALKTSRRSSIPSLSTVFVDTVYSFDEHMITL